MALNIGIHFFDLLLWLFGKAESSKLHLQESRKMAGALELERARGKWFLSTDANDLPEQVMQEGGYAYRSMTCDSQEIEFSGGCTDLHTRVYEEIVAGRGTGIADTRPAIELAHAISRSNTELSLTDAHPLVSQVSSRTLPAPDRHASKAA